ncbi:MAG: tRNA uridine-5-carboxymethylaminomethyl(34) synthesis GTPase MnmE [Bacteroidales bacterium]|nr:tRNA uridine-5-carboxymethylaminomethyl(34) synthesis GTPase MnmE [Bacteroidales bacterium]
MDAGNICAISTPQGNGAIAVVRVDGNEVFSLIDKIFQPRGSHKNTEELMPRKMHLGSIIEGEQVLDEVLLVPYHAPHSYTGNHMVEISCHGSMYIQQKLLQLLINHGARTANPGEFTMRAFHNGKMDLAQAEGVADLIASTSSASHKLAMQQMRGGFSSEIRNLREKLLNFISLIELELDFSEEDVEFADRTQLKELMEEIDSLISKLLNSFELGNAIKNGFPVAITGNTNVGKSTLLNRLLNEEKAIVTDIAGTTRDVIEDLINIQGIEFRFIDTAGIRDTREKIETIGIERTFDQIDKAQIVLLLVDATQPTETVVETIKKVEERIKGTSKKLMILLNKVDQVTTEDEVVDIEKAIRKVIHTEDELLRISAKQGTNIDKLTSKLLNSVNYSPLNQNEIMVTNVRHYEALKNAYDALQRAREGMESGLSSDLFVMDVRQVIHYLGEITGEITTDEVLGNIFKNFCVGK